MVKTLGSCVLSKGRASVLCRGGAIKPGLLQAFAGTVAEGLSLDDECFCHRPDLVLTLEGYSNFSVGKKAALH